MINDARQLNGQFYKPYSAKQYFSNFLNSILNEERFSGMPKPAFLEELSETILEKCTLNARAHGDDLFHFLVFFPSERKTNLTPSRSLHQMYRSALLIFAQIMNIYCVLLRKSDL